MKKTFLVFSVLAICALTTACTNNLAIQELNTKAKIYMQAGDVDSAICRLTSSLDLDSNFFETNYNLAMAYIQKKDFENAKIALEKAIKLNPDFADSYYSMGLIYEELADAKIQESQENQEINPDEDIKNDEIDENLLPEDEDKPLSEADKKYVIEAYTNSVNNYKTYIEKNPAVTDKKDVENKIEQLNNEIKKQMGLNDTDKNE